MAGRLQLCLADMASGKDRALDRIRARKTERNWPKAVIFDLDGTLIDSAPDIAAALNEVLVRRGLEPFPLERVKEMIGAGIPTLIKRALEAHGVEPHDIQPLVTDMLGVYAGRATALTVPFDGAVDELRRLRAAGVKLAICTNKNQDITDIIVRDLDMAQYFTSVVGVRPGGSRKPDPAFLQIALDELGVEAADVVLVGDSSADASVAEAAGMPVVLASFGYCHTPLEELEPDAIIAAFSELPEALQTLMARRVAMA
jgi:phosphoglycolate phosphatase